MIFELYCPALNYILGLYSDEKQALAAARAYDRAFRGRLVVRPRPAVTPRKR